MILRFLLWLLFLPLQFLLIALFWVAECFHQLARPLRTRASLTQGGEAAEADSGRRLCSIVIVNWNGRHLLEESLPRVLEAVQHSGGGHEVVVVDNGSNDDSVAWLNRNCPQVKVLALDSNLGFGEGNNHGVAAASHDIIVLLNNDMLVAKDFLNPLLRGLEDASVFAVSSQIFFPPGKRREETGNTRARLERGYLHLSHDPVEKCHYTRKYLPVLWAGGGSSAFDRGRFLDLGGFSDLFSPCYLEDTDLSYRAWRRGWKCLLAAESTVVHQHRSSSSVRFEPQQLQALIEERKLWYLWRNYQLQTLLEHFLWFPLHLTRRLPVPVYLRALRRLPQVLLSRVLEPPRTCSDRQLMEWTRHPLSYLNYFYPARRPPSRNGQLRILSVSAYLPHLGYHGGAGRVFQLLFRISLRRHQISLVSFVETPREMEEAAQIRPYCSRLEAVYRRDFLPISPFPYEPFEEFNSKEFRAKVEQVLAEEDFDLAHLEWTQMAQYADILPQIPKLLTEIEVNYAAHYSQLKVEPSYWHRFRKLYNSLQTLYREVEACRKVDKIICVTQEDREYLDGYVPSEKLTVVNTGVDTEFFQCGAVEKIEAHSLLFLGAFRHEPNVDAMHFFVREIFPAVVQAVPDAHLYVVGSSPPPSIMNLQSSHLTVTGFVSDIRDYYHKAHVVIVPLRTGVGIRGKILEGWAAGKAMVATPLACQGIRAVHGENIIVAEGAKEFALWTTALLENPDYCRRLGSAGRETAVECYDWSILGEQLASLYEDLARENRES